VFLSGIGRVDFLLDGFLIVEIDGFAFHSRRGDMLRDRARNNSSTVNGYSVLRYMPEHIWFNSDQVLAEIRAVLGSSRRNLSQQTCAPARLLRPPAAAQPGSPRKLAAAGEEDRK